LALLAEFLDRNDARRAAEVMGRLWAHGFRACALTGGFALEVQLISNGSAPQQRRLNDLDFIVEEFASIPSALAEGYLVHHIHADAPPGKILLQLIDRDRALRIDLFRALGATLSRAETPQGFAVLHKVVSIEDLAARTTSHVYSQLQKGRPIEVKHVQAFMRLACFGTLKGIEAAWQDHRQDLKESYREACEQAQHLLRSHPEFVFQEEYSSVVISCSRCRDHGPFQRAEPAMIVDALGFW
jgi:hypothetical protein